MKNKVKIILGLMLNLSAIYAMDENDRALFQAISAGDSKALIAAIKNGANVNAKDENGDTPICKGAKESHYLLQLIVKYAGFEKIEYDNIIKAFNSVIDGGLGRPFGSSILVKANAEVTKDSLPICIKSLGIQTPILKFAISNDVDMMTKLLHSEIDPEILNSFDAAGGTALMYASSRGNAQLIKVLLDYNLKFGGLDFTQCCALLETPLMLAKRNKRTEVLDLFEKHGNDFASQICCPTTKFSNPIGCLIVKLVFGDVFKKS